MRRNIADIHKREESVFVRLAVLTAIAVKRIHIGSVSTSISGITPEMPCASPSVDQGHSWQRLVHYLRLYRPGTQAFDGSWKPGDFEEVEASGGRALQ